MLRTNRTSRTKEEQPVVNQRPLINNRGTTFSEEFNNLPNGNLNPNDYQWPNQCCFLPFDKSKEYSENLNIYFAKVPFSVGEHVQFWKHAMELGICGIIAVDSISQWSMYGRDIQYGDFSLSVVENRFANFNYHEMTTIDQRNGHFMDCKCWLFNDWPKNNSETPLTTSIPHNPFNFLDFLRSIASKTYWKRTLHNRPIAILFS